MKPLNLPTWSPRKVVTGAPKTRPASDDAAVAAASPEIEEARQALAAADASVRSLEADALSALDEHLVPVGRRPVTNEAVHVVAGTHPAYGTWLPEVPEADRLEPVMSAAVVRRAHLMMERASLAVFGFDPVKMDLDGNVDAAGLIESPAQLAGESPMPEPIGRMRADEAVEEKLRVSERSIFYRAFLAIIPFVLRAFAGFFQQAGDAVADFLKFKILGKTIRVGKFVAKLPWWMAKLLRKLADKIEKAGRFGPNPYPGAAAVVPDIPPQTYIDEDGKEQTVEPLPDEMPEAELPPMTTDGAAGDGAQWMLMGAERVLRAVENDAQRSPGLARAARAFAAAREGRRVVGTVARAAEAWEITGDVAGPTPGAPTTAPESGFAHEPCNS